MDLQAPPSDETIVLKIDGEKQEGPDYSPQLPASLVPWNQPYPYLGAYPCIQCIYSNDPGFGMVLLAHMSV